MKSRNTTHGKCDFHTVESLRNPDKSLKHKWVEINDVLWLSSGSRGVILFKPWPSLLSYRVCNPKIDTCVLTREWIARLKFTIHRNK